MTKNYNNILYLHSIIPLLVWIEVGSSVRCTGAERRDWIRVITNCRSDVRVACREMVFSRYPLDKHICLLRLSSCEYQHIIYSFDSETEFQTDMISN